MPATILDDCNPAQIRARGFTLVELAIAVVIIGVLAAFGVPRYLNAVERSKAAEAYDYLWTVHSSQQRYQAQHGTYSADIDDLDVGLEAPESFSVGRIVVPRSASSLETGWQLTLTRKGASAGYGAYTVVFTQDGYERAASTIPSAISPMADATASGGSDSGSSSSGGSGSGGSSSSDGSSGSGGSNGGGNDKGNSGNGNGNGGGDGSNGKSGGNKGKGG